MNEFYCVDCGDRLELRVTERDGYSWVSYACPRCEHLGLTPPPTVAERRVEGV